jgi:uncharacterized protein involved in exopolysaccharide biosynthesis
MFMRRRVFLWMAARCSGIGLLVAAGFSYWMPRIYESRAVVALRDKAVAEQTRQEEAAFRVTLREHPQIPKSPISPDVLRNLAIGALAGLAVSPLLALFVARRRNATPDTPPAP